MERFSLQVIEFTFAKTLTIAYLSWPKLYHKTDKNCMYRDDGKK